MTDEADVRQRARFTCTVRSSLRGNRDRASVASQYRIGLMGKVEIQYRTLYCRSRSTPWMEVLFPSGNLAQLPALLSLQLQVQLQWLIHWRRHPHTRNYLRCRRGHRLTVDGRPLRPIGRERRKNTCIKVEAYNSSFFFSSLLVRLSRAAFCRMGAARRKTGPEEEGGRDE